MEYYILKYYQKAKDDCPEVEQKLDRFNPKTKRIVVACYLMMFLSLAEMIFTIFIYSNFYFIGIITLIVAMAILIRADSKDYKERMDKYVSSYKKKIEILEEVLEKFDIKDKKKIEELIDIYQKYINEENDKEKKGNRIIMYIFSALAGILTLSFNNMEIIGMDFVNWLRLAIFLLLCVSIAGTLIYLYTFLNVLKRKYELMIKDLKDLLFMKY